MNVTESLDTNWLASGLLYRMAMELSQKKISKKWRVFVVHD